jgi:GMP synthase-like glutamine amidotransferase
MYSKKILLIQQRNLVLEGAEREMFYLSSGKRAADFDYLDFFDPSWQNFEFIPENYSHIIMAGSNYNVSYGELDWFDAAKNIIKVAENQNIPFLGICFGMQFLCHTFGAEVIENKEKKEGGRVMVHNIDSKNTFFNFLPKSFETNAFHTDFVVSLPEEFLNLGHSEHCPIHIVAHKNKHLYGVQFHPEHNKKYIGKLGLHKSKYTDNLNKQEIADEIVEHYKLKDKVSEIIPRFLSL